MKLLNSLVLAMLMASASCSTQNKESATNSVLAPTSAEVKMDEQPLEAEDVPGKGTDHVPSGKMLIKTGQISFRTPDIRESRTHLEKLIAQHKGYLGDESLFKSENDTQLSLKVRIPSTSFDGFINSLEKQGQLELLNKSIHVQDVSTEFVDVETRLATKKEFLKKYQGMISKTNNIKDLLQIEESIRAIQEEIESSTARLNYLKNQVSLSTLDITLTTDKQVSFEPDRKGRFSERLKQSVYDSWYILVDVLLLVVQFWPVAVLIASLVALLRWFRRRRRQSRKS